METGSSTSDEIVTVGLGTKSGADDWRAPEAGTRVGRYELGDVLGRGGMGVVFEARDPTLDRRVAVKVVRPDRAGDDAELSLQTEARALAELSHPNIVQVYDIVRYGPALCIAMELVDGGSLSRWLLERPLSWRERVALFLDAGHGLAAAHAAGLVHRDFKPGNVLVTTQGRALVTDFGLARYVEREADGTDQRSRDSVRESGLGSSSGEPTSSVVGTPTFMAPEQHAGLPVDERADQFSFAVALHTALHGRHPFAAPTTQAVVERMLEGDVDAGSDRGPWPRRLDRALARALRAHPRDRWPSMEPLLAELQRSLGAARRTSYAAIGGAGVVVLGVGWWLLPTPDTSAATDECDAARGRLERVWGAERRADVAAALGGYESTAMVRLDDWVESWDRVHGEVCDAAPADERTARARCLVAAASQLGASVDLWVGEGEGARERAGAMVDGLPPPQSCLRAELGMPAPPPPQIAQTVDRLRDRLARAASLQQAGRFAEAFEVAEDVASEAGQLEYQPLQLEADYRVERLRDRLGEADVEAMRRVALEAEAAGYDDIVLAAATELVFWLGHRHRKPKEAARWRRMAQGAIERLSLQGTTREADFLHNVAWMQISARDLDGARATAKQALALRESLLGEHQSVAQSISTLGTVYKNSQRYPEAEAQHRRALALQRKLLGPQHPEVVPTLNNLASSIERQGRLDEAEPLMADALQTAKAALGPDHPHVALIAYNAGTIAQARFRFEAARGYYEQALRLLESKYGPDHPQVAMVVTNLGNLHDGQGAHEDARRLHQRALEITAVNHGQRSIDVANALGNLGRVARHAGELKRSEEHLREAIEIATAPELEAHDATTVAEHRAELGLTLVVAGQAEQACEQLRLAAPALATGEGNPTTNGLHALAVAEHCSADDPVARRRQAARAAAQLERAGPLHEAALARALSLASG